jgi:hypothetical protein
MFAGVISSNGVNGAAGDVTHPGYGIQVKHALPNMYFHDICYRLRMAEISKCYYYYRAG